MLAIKLTGTAEKTQRHEAGQLERDCSPPGLTYASSEIRSLIEVGHNPRIKFVLLLFVTCGLYG